MSRERTGCWMSDKRAACFPSHLGAIPLLAASRRALWCPAFIAVESSCTISSSSLSLQHQSASPLLCARRHYLRAEVPNRRSAILAAIQLQTSSRQSCLFLFSLQPQILIICYAHGFLPYSFQIIYTRGERNHCSLFSLAARSSFKRFC